MKQPDTSLNPLANYAGVSSSERKRLLDELDKTVTPFANATNTGLAYVSGSDTCWLSSCHECPCSQAGMTTPACIDQPQPERICHPIYPGPERTDCLIVCSGRNGDGLSSAIERMVRSITHQIEMEQEQEQLMEELSASWESLEAVYEISSDLELLGKPRELLERIINRAASYREGVKVILWIDHDGMLFQSSTEAGFPTPSPTPSGREGGLVKKVMTERNGIILNGRSRIEIQENLEPEFRLATNLAVIPLTSRHSSLGALSIWQEEDHGDFDSHDMRFLAALTLQAAMVVENDRLHRSSIETERLRQEIEIGAKIQQTLLLGQVPTDVFGIKVAALCIPSQMIGGDFYDFIKPHDNCLDVISGDVMGKGIPAALVGAATKNHFLRAMSQLLSSPAHSGLPEPSEIVARVHAELVSQLINLESFVTLCYARFDLQQRRACIVDCGHTKTVRYRPRLGVCDLLQGVNLPLGFIEQEDYQQTCFEMEMGDLFIFYSDGLTETMNAAGEAFGEDQLAAIITRHSKLDPEQLVAEIYRAVIEFRSGETLADDLTCVAVKILEPDPSPPSGEAMLECLSDLNNLEACRAFVRNICSEIPSPLVDDEFVSQLELAVTEAVANIMRHAYKGLPDQPIELSAQIFTDRIAFRIHHRGTSFSPDGIPPPKFDRSQDGGLGLFIIAQSVDDVSYTSDEQGGNCISLVKRFKQGNQDGSNTGKN